MGDIVNGKGKKISQSFQRWLLIVVVLAFLVTTASLWFIQTGLSRQSAVDLLELNIKDVRQDILDASDKNLLELTRKVAAELKNIEEVDSKKLMSLAFKYEVSEINYINENGIITASTNEDFIDFDMASGAQAAEFLILLNGAEEFVQSYQPITRDAEVYRKYGGVARGVCHRRGGARFLLQLLRSVWHHQRSVPCL